MISGTNLCNKMVVLRDICLSELDKNRWVHQQKALGFDHDTQYGVIFGTDFLTTTGIDIKYSTGSIQCFDNRLPMRDPLSMDNSKFLAMTNVVEQQCLEELYGMDWYDPKWSLWKFWMPSTRPFPQMRWSINVRI